MEENFEYIKRPVSDVAGSVERQDQSAKKGKYPTREKYAAAACHFCKRRKVKCSGGSPCDRCNKLGVVCNYAPLEFEETRKSAKIQDSDNELQFREINEQLAKLQDQVNFLLSRDVSHPHSHEISKTVSPVQKHLSPQSTESITRRVQQRNYAGPTSTTFSFNIANSSLERMGVSSIPNEPSSPSPRLLPFSVPAKGSAKDQILALGESEVLRLISIYQDNHGIVYPFLDVDSLKRQARIRTSNSWKSGQNFIAPAHESAEYATFDRDGEILNVVLAIALVFEGNGTSEEAVQLMGSAEEAMYKRFSVVETDLKELLIFTLMSIYHFECGEEVLAYRTAGLAARGALEMGLHRRDAWFRTGGIFPGDERSWALRVFWCIYVIDREWSFGAGMPFAIQDSDVDTEMLPSSESTPYLTAMIAYGRLCSKIWKVVTQTSDGRIIDTKSLLDLDLQVENWAKWIPAELQTPPPAVGKYDFTTDPNNTQRLLRVLLYLRKNYMRILIHRQVLFSTSSIMSDLASAQLVTTVAKDTIRTLHQLNQTSSIYRLHQTKLNYFLVSALAALFLAVCQAPGQFAESCQSEFHTALDLVKGFSAKSYASSRLSKTLERLKQIAPKLGLGLFSNPISRNRTPERLNGYGRPSGDPQQSSMRSTANQPVLNHMSPDSQSQQNQGYGYMSTYPDSGHQLSSNLMTMFEAAGGNFFDQNIVNNNGSGLDQAVLGNGNEHGQFGMDDFIGLEENHQFSELMMNLF